MPLAAQLYGQIRLGFLGRVGSNFPSSWLEQIAESGLDTSGVTVLPGPQDMRTFYAYRLARGAS